MRKRSVFVPIQEAPEQFRHSLRINESIHYRVRSGDGETGWHFLNVIDYPEIAEVNFAIDFPEYTKKARVEKDRMPRRVSVVQGSVLTLALKPQEPVEQLLLSVETKSETRSRTLRTESSLEETASKNPTAAQTIDLTADKDGWFRFETQLLDDVLLRPKLISSHGLENQRRLFSRIDVIVDKAPVARVINPTDESAIAVDEILEIEFEAHDDHGIATAELLVYDENEKDESGERKVVARKEIPLGDQQMQKHVRGKTTLDLKELGLPAGSEISYAVQVTDNRDVPAESMESRDQSMLATNENTSRSESANAPTHDSQDRVAKADSASDAKANSDRDEKPESNRTVKTENELAKMTANEKDSERDSSQTKLADTDSKEKPNGDRKAELESDLAAEMMRLANEDAKRNDSPKGNETALNEPKVGPDSMNEKTTDRSTENNGGEKESIKTAADNSPEDTNKLANDKPKDSNRAKTNSANNNSNPDASANPRQNDPKALANNDPRMNQKQATTRDSGGNMPKNQDTASRPKRDQDPSNRPKNQPNRPNTTPKDSDSKLANRQTNQQSPNKVNSPPRPFQMRAQQTRSGQNTMTNRRRIKITERLAAIATEDKLPMEDMKVRENVVEIDRMLGEVESGLRQLVDRKIADADREKQFRNMDTGLENVESYVSKLRQQTKDNQHAFVGLQMVDITRTHVTPARDRVFAAVQRPNASDAGAVAALQHIVRARELLANLLKRYDKVTAERKFKKDLEQSYKMHEVYVEKRRSLMREARQNLNPMQRKMAIIDVDQSYLDRYAEVLKLRREMSEEFARMLGDDPRLLSRYLDLVQRRSKTLRHRLTEISQLQYDATEELAGWLQVDDEQKQDFWVVILELRWQTAKDLASDTALMAERIEKQLPLGINPAEGTANKMISLAKEAVTLARNCEFEAERAILDGGEIGEQSKLLTNSKSLPIKLQHLAAAMNQLEFEGDTDSTMLAEYIEPRSLELRAVTTQADSWLSLSQNLSQQSYGGIVRTEQQQLAVETQLLRVEMLDMRNELNGQFRQLLETPLPDDIVEMIETLHKLMESITFNQIAAAYRAGDDRLELVSKQQQLAVQRLEEAEKLFDKIRRAVADGLDEYDPPDPDVNNLRDPTLDEFLANLEREPPIAAQIGIPNRRRNLRVLSDTVFRMSSRRGGNLGESGRASDQRMKSAMKMSRKTKKPNKTKTKKELSEEERQRKAEAKKMKKMLQDSLAEIEKRQQDQNTSAEQRRQLQKLADNIKEMMQRSEDQNGDQQAWQQMVQADQTSAVLEALANGESIDDPQWNRLISELEDGLWQVRGKKPPEAYREAIESYQDQIRELMQTIE